MTHNGVDFSFLIDCVTSPSSHAIMHHGKVAHMQALGNVMWASLPLSGCWMHSCFIKSQEGFDHATS